MVMHILISCVNVHTGSRDNLTVKKSMKKIMTNAVAQSIYFSLLWTLAKGTELNHFSITDLHCIDDGNVSVSMICNVPKPHEEIIFFKNGSAISRCRIYPVPPYNHCTNSSLLDVNAYATVMNYSMMFKIESAETDFLIGEWECQNGGTNDPSWSISFPNITCPTQSYCAPKINCSDGPTQSYCAPKINCSDDIVIGICLMLVPGLTALGCLIYKIVKDSSHRGLPMICLIGFIIIYLVIYVVITVLDKNNVVKTVLTVFCCLMSIPLIVIPVIGTNRLNCISREQNRRRVNGEGLDTWHCSACLHSSNDADLSIPRSPYQEDIHIDEDVPMKADNQPPEADTSSS